MTGVQELGYVEQAGGRWAWHARMIPGPYGSFANGTAATEIAARKALEAHWEKHFKRETK